MTDFVNLDDFIFDHDSHTYSEQGKTRLSVTQMIGACMNNYEGVPQRVLELARDRGIALHKWSAAHDLQQHGLQDLQDEWWGYVEGYLAFLADTRVRWTSVETQMIGEAFGVRYGMTYDRHGFWRDGAPVLGDLKFTAAAHASWGVQMALYEMGKTKRTRVGHMRRVAIQIKPNGTYKLHWFTDPSDADIARTVLHHSHGIGDRAQNEHIINTWRKNHRLLAA